MKDGERGIFRQALSYIVSIVSGGLAALLIFGVVVFAGMGGYTADLDQAMTSVVLSRPQWFSYQDYTRDAFEMYTDERQDELVRACELRGIGCIISSDYYVFRKINVSADKRIRPQKTYVLYNTYINGKKFVEVVEKGWDKPPAGYNKIITYTVTVCIPLSQLSHGMLLYAACCMRYPVLLIIAALVIVFIRFFTEIPLIPRFLFSAAALLWGEYQVIRLTEYRPDDELMVWYVSRAALLILALVILVGLELLKYGLRRIAGGDVEYRMKTRLRLGYFRETGELLNSISESTSRAVDDKMRSERLKTELIANVSHDIKTPLTSIINYVDLIGREQTDNERIAEYTQVLSRQSSRLKRLIEDLIDASKASSGSIDLELEPIDLKILLSQVLGDYEDALAERELTLIVTQPDDKVILTTDGRYMARIIDNLISNIKKYALEGTRVYVDMTDEGEKVRLSFKNVSKFQLNISAEELMERFTRGDRSRHTEGSGLGLNIAKSLTELMGGTIELFVDGDYFRVTLEFEK